MAIERHRVFVNGEDGYACYRIPSLVVMGNGELLALAEGRRDSCGDHGGVIRIVAKTSADSGATWSPLIEVARNVLPDGSEHVAQNPSPVIDRMDPAHPAGKVVLLFNKAEGGERDTAAGGPVRRVCVIESANHGRTWVNERDITTDVHRPNRPGYTAVSPDAATRYTYPDDWRAQFPPVGHAIQLRGGVDRRPETRGRLFFAAYTTIGDETIFEGHSYAIVSDDHGATWRHTEASPVRGVNESMAVELADGRALVNYRSYAAPDGTVAPHRGELVYDHDAGGRIIVPGSRREVPELPITRSGMQGSIIRLGWPDTADGTSRLLFSTCAHPTERRGMTVWLSEDDGRTWPVRRLVDPGPSAYSDLAALPDGRIALLYELGGKNGIDLAPLSLGWLKGEV